MANPKVWLVPARRVGRTQALKELYEFYKKAGFKVIHVGPKKSAKA